MTSPQSHEISQPSLRPASAALNETWRGKAQAPGLSQERRGASASDAAGGLRAPEEWVPSSQASACKETPK